MTQDIKKPNESAVIIMQWALCVMFVIFGFFVFFGIVACKSRHNKEGSTSPLPTSSPSFSQKSPTENKPPTGVATEKFGVNILRAFREMREGEVMPTCNNANQGLVLKITPLVDHMRINGTKLCLDNSWKKAAMYSFGTIPRGFGTIFRLPNLKSLVNIRTSLTFDGWNSTCTLVGDTEDAPEVMSVVKVLDTLATGPVMCPPGVPPILLTASTAEADASLAYQIEGGVWIPNVVCRFSMTGCALIRIFLGKGYCPCNISFVTQFWKNHLSEFQLIIQRIDFRKFQCVVSLTFWVAIKSYYAFAFSTIEKYSGKSKGRLLQRPTSVNRGEFS